jgi:hypothetical protein
MQEERDKLKKELLSKKEQKYKGLENSQPITIARNKKVCSWENPKGGTGQSRDKGIMGASHGLNQPSQQTSQLG